MADRELARTYEVEVDLHALYHDRHRAAVALTQATAEVNRAYLPFIPEYEAQQLWDNLQEHVDHYEAACLAVQAAEEQHSERSIRQDNSPAAMALLWPIIADMQHLLGQADALRRTEPSETRPADRGAAAVNDP